MESITERRESSASEASSHASRRESNCSDIDRKTKLHEDNNNNETKSPDSEIKLTELTIDIVPETEISEAVDISSRMLAANVLIEAIIEYGQTLRISWEFLENRYRRLSVLGGEEKPVVEKETSDNNSGDELINNSIHDIETPPVYKHLDIRPDTNLNEDILEAFSWTMAENLIENVIKDAAKTVKTVTRRETGTCKGILKNVGRMRSFSLPNIELPDMINNSYINTSVDKSKCDMSIIQKKPEERQRDFMVSPT